MYEIDRYCQRVMQDQLLLLPFEGRAMVRADYVFCNMLLRSLDRDDLAALAVHLQPLKLPIHLSFEKPGEDILRVCFPEHGIISVVVQGGRQHIEVGLIGHEGMSGGAVIMGDGRSVNDVYVQVAGDGHCIDADDLRNVIASHPSLLKPLLRYLHVFGIQTAHSALANGRFRIDERLARWLLMAQDRMESEELQVTHEFLAIMLGVRRPGVTEALHRLEGDQLIRSVRGTVFIRRRDGLEALADGSYGVPEDEYARLCGPYFSAPAANLRARALPTTVPTS